MFGHRLLSLNSILQSVRDPDQLHTPSVLPPRMSSIFLRPYLFRGARRRLFADVSPPADDHPVQIMRTSQWSPAKKARLSSNLFMSVSLFSLIFPSPSFSRKGDGDWTFDSYSSSKYFYGESNFSLENLYNTVSSLFGSQ